jgi:hypothetical protein
MTEPRDPRFVDGSLDGQLADVIAERVVELLHGAERTPARLVDAATVAEWLGVSRDYVYAHADELGVKRIGNGPRGCLRFDLDRVLSTPTSCFTGRESRTPKQPVGTGKSAHRRGGSTGSSTKLLPIRGSATPAESDRAHPR